METDDESPDEDKYRKRKHNRKKKHKPSLCDKLIERPCDSVQEQLNETVKNALEDDSSMELGNAEDKAFEEMKPAYRSALMTKT